MSEPYTELLEATVRHLEMLRSRGARFVSVSPEALQALAATTPGPASRPVLAKTTVPTSIRPAPAVTIAATPAPAPTVAATASMAGTDTTGLCGPAEKVRAIAEVRERAQQCVKCAHLSSTRTNVVFGVGNVDADLMFVGEAPGADEDIQGEPFVGAAGQLLTRMIQTMGLSRESVYIANILKCRPDMPVGSSGNRKPTAEEMQTCIPYLHAQIDIIQPKVLVALGGTAVEGLLNLTGITKLRGKWQTYRGIPLMPTYHPAYLLRNQSPAEKRRVWEDLLAVMEKLGLTISEKQRGYFLPKPN